MGTATMMVHFTVPTGKGVDGSGGSGDNVLVDAWSCTDSDGGSDALTIADTEATDSTGASTTGNHGLQFQASVTVDDPAHIGYCYLTGYVDSVYKTTQVLNLMKLFPLTLPLPRRLLLQLAPPPASRPTRAPRAT